MGIVNLKDIATNLILGNIFSAISGSSAKDAGKVSAKLLKKSKMDIPDAPSDYVRQDPLGQSYVHYPLDLTTNELGHYMLFESGFVGYSPQTSTWNTAHDPVIEERTVPGVPQLGYKPFKQTIKSGTTARDFTTEKLTSKLPSHEIDTAGIAIYMPANVKVTYGQEYDNDTAGMAGDLEVGFEQVKGAQGAANKIEAALKGVATPIARQAKQMLGEFISLAGAGDPIRFAAKRAGAAINPRNEMFYNSPTMRTFSYSFDFWPRNEKEATAMEQIIGLFKHHSAPGVMANTYGGVFTIPNYWKISYMYNGEENTHLNRISACYCTSVDVDYSPDGQWSTQADGTPVHTKLSLSFVEDRIINKTDIEAGA